MKFFAFASATALALTAPAIAQDAPQSVVVELKNNAGASAGKAELVDGPNGVLMRIEAKGLKPGWHGLHFHEVGDCSKSDFTSAGAHVHAKPQVVHGLLNPDATEAGDLPNLFAGPDGSATAEVFTTYVALKNGGGRPGLGDTDGSAIVIHANPDDHRAQPIGGAGPRVACGVIPPVKG
jgi:Cu-Zn family superoxide dismutase